jgi:hypothetical protein
VLTVSLPGEPDHGLEPYTGTEFTVQGLSGFSIRFVEDEAGVIVSAILNQIGGVYTAEKR